MLKTTSLKLARSLDLKPSEEAAIRFSETITSWPAFKDTAPTLRTLGQRGYKRIILSNIDKNLLGGTIKNNDLEVEGFVTAEDVKSYKPNTDHWLEFLKLYKTQKEEVLHVANSVYHDIIPAQSLGIKTVWVNRYNEAPSDGIIPSYTIEKLSELLTILNTK